MTTTPLLLSELFDKTKEVLRLVREGKREKDALFENALRALYNALVATSSYLEARQSGQERDRSKEVEIARLWYEASIPLRNIDEKLARRCFLKGSYWLRPNTWSDEWIRDNRLTIAEIMEDVEGLL